MKKGVSVSFLAKTICISILFIIFFGCGSENLQLPADVAFPPTFTNIRNRILIPRCANCHSGVVSHKVLLATEKMAIVPGNSAESTLYQKIESGEMPKYGQKLTDEEMEAIKSWIDNGAKND
jgi:uncharacterized membrane protein